MMKKQKVLSLFLVISLIAGLLPVLTISAAAYDSSYDIDSGSVSISIPGNYYISGTGSPTTNSITIAGSISGSVYITLEGVAINKSSNGCAFSIGSGSTVYLTLTGTNSLISGDSKPGLRLPGGAYLIITSDSTGSLTANGGYNSCGIGGHDESCGALTINGGTISASGSTNGAGIGGGVYIGGGVITINGGTVTATGGSNGAGIGGGLERSSGTTTINGGTVTAIGGSGAAGIGGGKGNTGSNAYDLHENGGTGAKGGSCGAVTISGGLVTATGSNGGAGIGGGAGGTGGNCYSTGDGGKGGNGGDGGTVMITGGTVIASIGGGSGGNGGAAGDYGYDGSSGSSGSSGSFKIINGSVNASFMAPTPTNGTSTVYLTRITGLPTGTAVVYMADGSSPTSCITDSSGYLYLWQPVTGSSSTILVINAGTYYGASGTVTTGTNTFAALAVTATAVSGVAVSPSSETLSFGDTLSLTATVSPTDATDKSVTWSSSDTSVATVSNTGVVTVVSGGTAIITATTTNGSSTSTCTITVHADAPTISSNPAEATVDAGGTATLSVAASVNTGTLSYKWYSNTSNSNAGGTAISSAIGSSYAPSTAIGGTTYYYCEVTNTFGTATAASTSSVAKVTVNTASAPTINSSLSDATVTQGETATLSIDASTTSGTLSYQWYSNTTGSTTGATAITGATASTYSPPTAGPGMTYYYCIVTSTLGTSTATATSGIAAVTVTAQAYALAISSGTGGSITTGSNGNYAAGAIVNIAATAAANYSFSGWTSTGGGSFGSTTSSSTTFAMPAGAATITANFTYSGSTGGGGGSGGSTTTYTADVSAKDSAGTGITGSTLKIAVDQQTGIATLDIGSQQGNIIAGGGTVAITVPSITGVTAYAMGIPVAYLNISGRTGTLTFNSDTGSISLPSNMLAGIEELEGTKAEITIGQGDKSNLSEAVKNTIGNRPLIQLAVTIDGKPIEWNNPDAPVTISIPYTPTVTELENPESIVIWYIDGSGNAVSVPNGHYDSATGTVTFTTTHFSFYAVRYNQVRFNDVDQNAWYSDAVNFIAARSITTGTDNGKYNPDAKLTRGQFIVMLMRAYSIEADLNPTDNFADAGNTYYTGYLAAAKRLGISAGIGDKLFAPDEAITRQEMFSLLYNALKSSNALPDSASGKTLSDFSDGSEIASWAADAMTLMVETGAISGSDARLYPDKTTTRAEMAQVLYNLLTR